MTDFLTILTHSHSRLTKMWMADGTISGYDETKNYQVGSVAVSSIQGLSAVLTGLESQHNKAVIRGKFKGDAAAAVIDADEYKPGLARKISALYDDVPHHWVLIEVDNFTCVADPLWDTETAINEYVTASLPSAFHDISYHWQLSSSAGHVKSAGGLKVHLWFWLATAATSVDLKAWAKASPKMTLDSSVFNSVQLHFTSAPMFAPGVSDPVPLRSGLVNGMFGDSVDLDLRSTDTTGTPGTALATWDDDLMSLSPTLGWTTEFARELMMSINADSDRATWVSDLSALHHETGGSAEGLEIAVEWSQTASNFCDRKDVEGRWESFGKYRGSPITGKWLLKRRSECHVQLKYRARAEWAAKIEQATDEFTVREKVCPEIAKDTRLDDFAKKALSQLLHEAFKRMGSKYPIADCRKLLDERRLPKADRDSPLPEWAEPWVYITNTDKFFRPDSEETLTMQGFNARFNRELPCDESGSIALNASWTVLNEMGLMTVTKSLYLPWAPAIFTQAGVQCVNTYRPSTAPTPVDTLTPAHWVLINRVVRHIDLIAGGRKEVVQTMLDWIAHNVQNPGVKVRWAPLIKGVEGDGKTILSSLVACIMGRANVRNIGPKVLGTDFTGWAEGAAVGVLEEMRLTGHSRYDIANALKPFITNDSIEVHSKGKDTREVINTMNYIAFTNYVDALPLTDTDRRWWTIFSPFSSIAEMETAVKKWCPDLGVYFDELHEVINQYPAVLRRWMLDFKISADFRPNSSAPMSAEKAVMIGMNTSDDEDAVRDVLEHCEPVSSGPDAREATRGVTKRVFSSRCMGDALVLSDAGLSLPGYTRNKLFSRVGFTKMPKKIKWNGEAHVVWVKGHLTSEPDEIRKILNGTLPKNEGDELFGDFAENGSGSDDLF